jgi:hypothetical protein
MLSTRAARSACSTREWPMISSGSRTLPAMARHGNSPAAWNT